MRGHMIYIARAGIIRRREALNRENGNYAERTGEGSQDQKETPEERAAYEGSG